jgi:signal transduction histidine kinase
VNHELRLPVGNVMNFAEMLSEELKKYNDNQLQELSDEVFKNSNRLSTMILNMLDLALLDVKKIELNKKTINLGELVEDRVNNCRKIYLQGKKIDFELKIEPNIMVTVDPNYIRQTVDNLVINAITYSQSGTIKVNPFKMGIHTQSKAEGRGVGLALCKSAVEAHGGAVSVISENGKGAVFKIVLGLN